MTLTAGIIIDAARNSHPAFDRGAIPSSVAARYVNEAQRRFLLAAHERNQTYLTRRWTILLLPNQDVAQVGAGTQGSAPLLVGTTALRRSLGNTGSAATLPDDPIVLVPERAATSAGGVTLVDTTASMPVDLYVGQLLVIVSGLGAGQVRDIASNTSDTFTVTEAWTQVPDDTSTYAVLGDNEVVTGSVGISMGQQPTTVSREGWLVYLDAQGNPYLDLAAPVTVPVSDGIPIPPHYYVNHGLVRFVTDPNYPNSSKTFTISTLDAQANPPMPYSGAIVDQKLQLFRPFEQWKRVTSIEIPYLPLAPTVSGYDDVLFLPDTAEEALVARVALQMAKRVRAMDRLGDPSLYRDIKEQADETEALYLNSVAGVGRATKGSVVSVW